MVYIYDEVQINENQQLWKTLFHLLICYISSIHILIVTDFIYFLFHFTKNQPKNEWHFYP